VLEEKIASRYGAAEVILKEIRAGQGGAKVFEARLDGARYALRLSGPFLSGLPEWVEFEGAMLERARMRGVRVASARRGVDSLYGQFIDDTIALLTDWAEGNVEWPTPPGKARALGAAVGKLHVATEAVWAPTGIRPFDTYGLLGRPMALLKEVANPSALSPFVAEMRERIEAIPNDLKTFGPVHGDLHQGNCHFDGDKVTLFDFAECGVGWRAFDLAGFLWPWRDDHIKERPLRAACDAYLEGYRSARKLSREEEHALPALVRVRDLWETGEWIATGDGAQKPQEVQKAIDNMAQRWSNRPLPKTLTGP